MPSNARRRADSLFDPLNEDLQAMPSTRILKAAGFFGSGEREDIDVFLYRRRSQYAALWIADCAAPSENNAGRVARKRITKSRPT